MYNEKQNMKACFKEAEKEYSRRQKEQDQRNSEQNIQLEKVRISSKVDHLQAERDKLVMEAVELRRIDPEAAKLIIAQGADIDAAIRQARKTLATANGMSLQSRVEELIDESIGLMRDINTRPISYTSMKNRKKLRREKAIHDILKEMAAKSREEEISLYTGGIISTSGAGSAFENDVLAAERKALIEEIDDEE